jgi:hypothetical protein
MFMTYDQTAGQNHNNHNIKAGNKSFKTMAEFRILRMMVINQSGIHEAIKCRLNGEKFAVMHFRIF